jgi:MoaA/NifB/PqqE/SkfB family radical SAM enzyme
MKENVNEKSYTGVIEDPLSIEVTTRCNIDCAHCFARAGISERSSLSLELAKEIIDEGYNVGYRHLHFTGGEPLLWEGLIEVLDYAFDVGHQTVFLNTNGTLLSKSVSSRLAAYDGLSISVSLEGTETLHNHLRGGDSYSRTVQGIERALDADIELSIFTTACKSLLPELPHFADDLFKTFPDIEFLTLIQLIPATDGVFALSNELLGPRDFLQLVDQVSLLNLLGLRTRFLNNPLAYVASKLLRILWIPRSAPLYCEGRMIIMANRDICLSHSSKDSFGKYELGMIENVLVSDKYRNAVAPDEKTCPSCKYSELCSENGMVRPSEGCWGTQSDVLYCQKVLGSVVT